MLMVQRFHSIHEIDPEFVTNVETLLQEDVPSYDVLVQKHDTAPATDSFTYFLFFGPTQNAPIGFAQLSLRKIPWAPYLPWWERLCFWKKDHLHWKEVIWKLGDGTNGLAVFDPRFARSGKEKVQELIKEYEGRSDIMAQNLLCVKGLQDYGPSWSEGVKSTRELYVLEPLPKAHKSYQDFLESLDREVKAQIKSSWKTLHKDAGMKLGDYPNPLEAPKSIPLDREQLERWGLKGHHLLTFEKDGNVLGCLLIQKGKGGNVFFEPFIFEAEDQPIITEVLYTQYALLKFFEIPEARKCHLMRSGAKLVFEERADLAFFTDQGFSAKTILQSFASRLKGLENPV